MIFGKPKIAKNFGIELGAKCASCFGTSTYAVILERRILINNKKLPGMVCRDCYSAFELENKKINEHILDVYENKITKDEFKEKMKEHISSEK